MFRSSAKRGQAFVVSLNCNSLVLRVPLKNHVADEEAIILWFGWACKRILSGGKEG